MTIGLCSTIARPSGCGYFGPQCYVIFIFDIQCGCTFPCGTSLVLWFPGLKEKMTAVTRKAFVQSHLVYYCTCSRKKQKHSYSRHNLAKACVDYFNKLYIYCCLQKIIQMVQNVPVIDINGHAMVTLLLLLPISF